MPDPLPQKFEPLEVPSQDFVILPITTFMKLMGAYYQSSRAPEPPARPDVDPDLLARAKAAAARLNAGFSTGIDLPRRPADDDDVDGRDEQTGGDE